MEDPVTYHLLHILEMRMADPGMRPDDAIRHLAATTGLLPFQVARVVKHAFDHPDIPIGELVHRAHLAISSLSSAEWITRNRLGCEARSQGREGQFWFNQLFRDRPSLAERIRNTGADPYLDDGNLVRFFAYLTEHWG